MIAHDEWTTSTTGFQAPSDPGRYVRNVTQWFGAGQPSRFLCYTSNFGLNNDSISDALTADGHTYDRLPNAPFTLLNLLTYNAVFVCGRTLNQDILIQYVQAGGNVYLCGGTGSVNEPIAYNTFLNAFGLAFASGYNGLQGHRPINNNHPLFSQVDHLYDNNGSYIIDSDLADPRGYVIIGSDTQGIYATYDGGTVVTISGVVDLQNFGGDAGNQIVQFDLRQNGFTVESRSVNLLSDGSYSFTTTASGVVDIASKGSHWLRQTQTSVDISGGASGLSYSLLNGDADPDNEVNLVDFGTVSASFGKALGDADFNPMADLDGDDEVTLVDVAIVSANFGLAGDE